MDAKAPPDPATAPRRPPPRARRALALDSLRTFEAVARRLSFSAAAVELHLTQPAISRQIKALEDELGAALFHRGTRRVELTAAGHALRQATVPALERIDRAVRQIRAADARRQVVVSTYASFASLWLLPRLDGFQRRHPDIDIRISATDRLIDLDDPEVDIVLRRYFDARHEPPGGEILFGETLTPVANPRLLDADGAPLRAPADLARHALLEELNPAADAAGVSWRHWLRAHGCEGLEPRRWIHLDYLHQEVQAAIAGQGVSLGRSTLVHDAIGRGELVEPFGAAGRIASPARHWMIVLPGARSRPELAAFVEWLREEAAATRAAGAAAAPPA